MDAEKHIRNIKVGSLAVADQLSEKIAQILYDWWEMVQLGNSERIQIQICQGAEALLKRADKEGVENNPQLRLDATVYALAAFGVHMLAERAAAAMLEEGESK